MSRYRTGRSLGRTVYRDDRLIGVMDTAEDGALVVELLNARERVLATTDPNIKRFCATCGVAEGQGHDPECYRKDGCQL